MKQNKLMLIRASTKEVILSEIVNTPDELAYILIHPFIITITDAQTSASPFLPGAAQNNFVIQKDFVTTMAPPDEFICKFYGSILFRDLVQSLLRREPIEGDKIIIDNYIETKLFVEKQEIMMKFGMLGDNQVPVHYSGAIH